MDMKTRLISTLILLGLLIAACAPGTSQPPAAAQPVVVESTATPLAESVLPTLAAATQAPAAEVPTALPVATSRGPDLHATDPSTVSLASGELHFVEFFRFT
jgi:hypothetical protein